MRTILLTGVALMLLAVAATAEDKPPTELGLSVYKLGEKYATDEQAKQPIDDLCAFLNGKVEGAKFVRRGIRNKPEDALKLLKDDKDKTAVAIMSPGLYFANKEALKLTAIAEARRGGNDGEQYVLYGKTKADGYPAGKRIATNMTADKKWLDNVVLPITKGLKAKPVEWVQYDNLMDAGYAIADDEKDAPDYVLLDRVTAAAFTKDADLKESTLSYESAVLPQELVVEIDGRLGDKRDTLKAVLAKLDESEAGKKLGVTLQTATFVAPDEKRLTAAEKAFKGE
ncbi:MAG: hypothetical protein IT462_08660 [Planctomycetes bacterium]|nr:hypothetical protein [Planctomycetota bacterium]